MRVRPILAFVILAVALGGCDDSAAHDPRFADPAAALGSLFTAYGVQHTPEDEIQRRLAARSQFALHDRELYRECFSDWRSDHDEGLAGYVFGRLAAGKEHLRIEREGDRATITVFRDDAAAGPPVVLSRDARGWRFVLRESVPAEVRQQLYRVYERALAAR